MTNKKFFYYYTDRDFRENKEPLGYFEIKNLYKLEILPDYSIGGKKNIFSITVSQWNKKDVVHKGRTFFLSTETKEKLTEWVTQINFLRVKATYDEFSSTFGLINLPLPHEGPEKGVKKIKNKLNNSNYSTVFPTKTSMSFYNCIARRSVINQGVKGDNDGKRNSLIKGNRRASFMPKNITEKILEDIDNQNKIKKSKENLVISFNIAFICIMGFIQDIIFNIDNVGIREEKTISVSKSLKELLTKFYNISKESVITPKDSTNYLSPVNSLNNNEKRTKNDEKESINCSSTSMANPYYKSSAVNQSKRNKIETIKEENYISSQDSLKAMEEEINNFNLNKGNKAPNKDRRENESLDKGKAIFSSKKENENNREINEKEIFINLEYKVKRDFSNDNFTNPTVVRTNNNNAVTNINNTSKNPQKISNDSSNTNNPPISNNNLSLELDKKGPEEINLKAKAAGFFDDLINQNIVENNNMKTNNTDIKKQSLISETVKIEKRPILNQNSTFAENQLNNSRGRGNDKSELIRNSFYELPGRSSNLNTLLLNEKNTSLDNNKITIKRNQTIEDILNNQEMRRIKTVSDLNIQNTDFRRNENLPSTPFSQKFKNFDLFNEDYNELFKQNSELSPKNGNGNVGKKKKKNIIIDDDKYHDIKTKENFNFYSSNIFSKKNEKK